MSTTQAENNLPESTDKPIVENDLENNEQGLSQVEEKDTFCDDGEQKMQYDTYDNMILTRSLRSVTDTLTSFINENISQDEAFIKVKTQYSIYKCDLKKDLNNTKEHKKLIKEIMKWGFIIGSTFFCLWLVKQIIKTLKRKAPQVPILYALAYLVIFNPIYSFITITIDLIKYRSINVESNVIIDIDDIESKIESMLKCKDNLTKETACEICKFFNANACVEEEESNKDDIDTKFSNKMERLNNVNQFMENQKNFVLKSRNSLSQIKSNDKLDECLKFMVVDESFGNTLDILKDNIETADKTNEIFMEASAIRAKFEEKNKNFNENLTKDFDNLCKEVILLINSDISKYLRTNKHVTADNLPDDLSVFIEASSIKGSEEKVTEIFYEIITKLRKLNKSYLPEYELLRKFIFINESVEIQQKIYNEKSSKRLDKYILNIVGYVVNNESLIKSASNGSDKFILEQASEIADVRTDIYMNLDPNYENKESLVLKKTEIFVKKLPEKSLPLDFMKQHKYETILVKAVITNMLQSILDLPISKIMSYLKLKIEQNNYFIESSTTENIFYGNLYKLIKYAISERKLEKKNQDLYFTKDSEFDKPNDYISFDEFSFKLDNINESQMNLFVDKIKTSNENIKTLVLELNTLNDKLEKKTHMANYYKEYIYIYVLASFFILLDVVYSTYYDKNIDIAFIQSGTQK